MTFDWQGHRKHRTQVVADTGQWVGLLDEEGVPLMEISAIISMEAPQARLEPSSLQLTVDVHPQHGVVPPLVGELIAGGLGAAMAQDEVSGALVPANDPTRFVCVEREGARYVYRVTHVVAQGPASHPTTLVIHGVDVLDLVNNFPAPSFPGSWLAAEGRGWRYFDRDWSSGLDGRGGEFDQPRYMRPVDMVGRADGFTHAGGASAAIRQVLRTSLEAVYSALELPQARWPIVVAAPDEAQQAAEVSDPKVFIHPSDGPLFDTVKEVAAAAGVQVSASMWWPGDSRKGLPGWVDGPVVVVSVSRMKGA